MTDPHLTRRRLLRLGAITAATTPLAGCSQFDFLSDPNDPVRKALISANDLTFAMQRLLLGRNALARQYAEADIRQAQKPNGSTDPRNPAYLKLKADDFRTYRLAVTGHVDRPAHLSLADLAAMPQRTQITRHDCVEGWSTIAKWQGVQLSRVLDTVGVKPEVRYVVFHCYDALEKTLSGPDYYYESIDMVDVRHPQTILALKMNDKPLPVANGAPLRVRVERQLGYKMAKYIKSIELVKSFADIKGGKGGFWEDRGYEWYAGI